VTSRRPWAALATLCTAVALVASSAAEPPAPGPGAHLSDAGSLARPGDAGESRAPAERDGGKSAPFNAEDLEVVQNLDLLEHLPESDILDLLLPLRDE
jgi:hypothetical protein